MMHCLLASLDLSTIMADMLQLLKLRNGNGGSDGTRTRDLLRDSPGYPLEVLPYQSLF